MEDDELCRYNSQASTTSDHTFNISFYHDIIYHGQLSEWCVRHEYVSQGSPFTMLNCGRMGGERDERIRNVYHMLTTYYNPIVHTDVLYNNL